MAKKRDDGQERPADNDVRTDLPPGVKLLRALKGYEDAVKSVAFDPQGRTLASGSTGGTVKLWEVRSGKLLRRLERHSGSVLSVAFDPQGRTLASGSADGTAKLWEARSGKLVRTLEVHKGWATSVAFDPLMPPWPTCASRCAGRR
jgi:WD40 repeat protein